MADYSKMNHEDLIKEIYKLLKNINQINTQKKYGLVWEEKESEYICDNANENYPVLHEVMEKRIETNKNNPVNLIIEGDNYDSLRVLSYTHQGKVDVIYIDPPFNTGAKDWKYNNNYVDANDTYRHSRWLSMMSKRLQISKRLLRDDGVLICAIDENEVHHLGVLLEEIFNGYEIHCITIIHNPRGVQGKNFSYTNEFAYFVFRSGLKVIGPRKIKEEDIDWRGLRDSGKESMRTDARNCFYPIIIKNEEIVGFGDVLSNELHPKQQTEEKESNYYIWPIDSKGIERKWRYARQSVDTIKDMLKVKKTKNGYDINIGKNFGIIKTVWQDSRYDASEYGTKLLQNIVPTATFNFPKSLYAVYDCLDPIVSERKNAIILDFFAGSGTTGHAVMELNKEDGGNRQFILCTNNENKICEDVTYPRIHNVINGYINLKGEKIAGLGGNIRYMKVNYVPAEKLKNGSKK